MMHRIILYFTAGIAGTVLIMLMKTPDAVQQFVTTGPAPEFTGRQQEYWINSKPLSLRELRGKVVLVDFWTFDCWNCYRSFPWLNRLEGEFKNTDLRVIGIHSPEFEHERARASVERKVAEFGLHHPVMIDNDFRYWEAMGNRYWPAFYLIDRKGFVRAAFFGETHTGDKRAQAIESTIRELLAESAEGQDG